MTIAELLDRAFAPSPGQWRAGLTATILALVRERTLHPQAHARQATPLHLSMDELLAKQIVDMIAARLNKATNTKESNHA